MNTRIQKRAQRPIGRIALLASAAVSLTWLSAPAWSDENSVSNRIQACAEIQNPLERLVCYDEIALELGAEVASGPARGQGQGLGQGRGESQGQGAGLERAAEARSEAQQRADERAEAAERRAREAEARAQEAEARAQEAEARRQEQARSSGKPIEGKEYVTIDEAWQNARGLWFFRLDNGQVWRQQEAGRFNYDPNTRYYIEEGRFLNSYFMGTDGSNRRIRVQIER